MTSLPPDDRALLDWLAAHDDPCPACGYSLRGLGDPVCPECSMRLRLTVGAPGLRLGPWVAGIIAPALALGFDGVMSLVLIWALVTSPGVGVFLVVITGVFILLGAASAAVMLAVIRSRRRWLRRRPAAQIRWAAALFAVVGVVHAVWGVFLVSLII